MSGSAAGDHPAYCFADGCYSFIATPKQADCLIELACYLLSRKTSMTLAEASLETRFPHLIFAVINNSFEY